MIDKMLTDKMVGEPPSLRDKPLLPHACVRPTARTHTSCCPPGQTEIAAQGCTAKKADREDGCSVPPFSSAAAVAARSVLSLSMSGWRADAW